MARESTYNEPTVTHTTTGKRIVKLRQKIGEEKPKFGEPIRHRITTLPKNLIGKLDLSEEQKNKAWTR